MKQKRGKFSREKRVKDPKIYCFLNFPFWWYKDWNMSLYKPEQIKACIFLITEKSQII